MLNLMKKKDYVNPSFSSSFFNQTTDKKIPLIHIYCLNTHTLLCSACLIMTVNGPESSVFMELHIFLKKCISRTPVK